jgi:hypothetical protein
MIQMDHKHKNVHSSNRDSDTPNKDNDDKPTAKKGKDDYNSATPV